MNERIRVGLVGAGRIVQEGHLPAYLANRDVIDVTAVADPDQRSAAEAGDALGIPPGYRYAGLSELLDRHALDLVVVASPSHEHHRAVVSALARHVGVICEKPLCLDASELASIKAAAGARGFVAVLHNYLAKPGWRHVIDLIREGRLGMPTMVRFEELSDDHWRLPGAPRSSWRQRAELGGGPLRDNLYHALYLAEQVLGSPLYRASGQQAALAHGYPAGDTAMIVARHLSGALSQATAAWCFPGLSRATTEICGTKAAIRYDYWAEPGFYYLDDGSGPEQIAVPGWTADLESGYIVGFRDIVRRFRSGLPPEHGVADAERIMRVMAQVPLAARHEGGRNV
jgi:predicted dehydrogenase